MLSLRLQREGYIILTAGSGQEAIELVNKDGLPDLAVLDIMMPGMDGFVVADELRQMGEIPIIFLSALSDTNTKVEGLNRYAEDYVTKPFAFSELLARVNAIARRPPLREKETVLKVGDLEMDLIARTVKRRGAAIDLQPREFRLLEVLMRNRGRVVTRTMLLERVWDFHFDPKTTVVETHISRLRAKVDRPYDVELIHTVRGTGYRVDDAR